MRYSIFTLEVSVRYLPKVTDNGNSRTITILGLSERRRIFGTTFTISEQILTFELLKWLNSWPLQAAATSTLIPTVLPSHYLESSARNWAVVASRQTVFRSTHILPLIHNPGEMAAETRPSQAPT